MDDAQTAFQLIDLPASGGLRHPPMLVQLLYTPTHSTTSQPVVECSPSQSNAESSGNRSSIALKCSVTRFVNGRQQVSRLDVQEKKLLEACRKGHQSAHMTVDETIKETFAGLENTHAAQYDSNTSELKVRKPTTVFTDTWPC